MSCLIKDPSYFTANGSCSLYGGGIVSVSFSPSLLNGQNRASVTVAGKGMSTPAQGDGVTLGILGGAEMDMIVGSYSTSNSANSISQLTVNLYDRSHQFLDNSFVFLKEEVPQALAAQNVAILGRKKGPRPDTDTLYKIGVISPSSDTMFVDIRDFYEGYQNFRSPITPPILDMDKLVQEAPGKTLYFVHNDPNGGTTLSEAYGNLIDGLGSVPNGPFDFTGPLRDVIIQICDELGYVASWDMAQNKVKIEPAIDITKGKDAIEKIKDSCYLLSSSSTSDFTVTRAQGAFGSVTSSFPGEDQDQSGGSMRRYMLAKKINPDFHIREFCGSKKLIPISFKDNVDLQKAITASKHPEVYAMYALQTMLAKKDFPLPVESYEAPLYGADNATNKTERKLENFKAVEGKYSINEMLAKYYGSNAKEACQGKVWAVETTNPASQESKELDKSVGKMSETKPMDPPFSLDSCGPWVEGECKFADGTVFLHKKDAFQSIMDTGGDLEGEGDILRKYLHAISNFQDMFYVIKEQSGLRSVRTLSKNYGYYVTSSAGSLGADPDSYEGFQPQSVNPFAPIYECDISELVELAKACCAMYLNQGCTDDFLSENTIVDFIWALEKNKLQDFFQGKGRFAQKQNIANQLKAKNQEVQMFLLIKNKQTIQDPIFQKITKTCFNGLETFNVESEGPAKKLAEKLGTISVEGKVTPLNQLKEVYNLMWIVNGKDAGGRVTSNDMNSLLTPFELRDTPNTVKMWYDVKGSSASAAFGIGQFQLSAAAGPPSNSNTWKSSINSVNVNAADIARANGINQTYLADSTNDVFTFSRFNLGIMGPVLDAKIASSTWIEDDVGHADSVTFIVNEDIDVDIPGPEDGLDGLDLRGSDGRIEATITVGNANLLRSKAALRDLKAKNSHLLHGYMNVIPNAVQSSPNTKFINISKGNV